MKLTELFFVPDPTTGEQRTGDYFQLPLAWVRFHLTHQENTLYEPDFMDGGPTPEESMRINRVKSEMHANNEVISDDRK